VKPGLQGNGIFLLARKYSFAEVEVWMQVSM
jgi:hypothetical protein